MRILMVGGTVFLGRALSEAALNSGHQVTLLNRGKSAATVPEGVTHLVADRDGDLAVLRGHKWDVVIDTCAYFPRQVRSLLAILEDNPHYTLISSVSAYADLSRTGIDETGALAEPEHDPAVQSISLENYGPLKSACEEVCRSMGSDRSLIIRPGILVGPHDPTGRFAYWVRRLNAGNEFVAPGDGTAPLQVIDVRDLAAWTLRLVELRTTGAFNAVGPREALTFGQCLATGQRALGGRAQPVWVPEAYLTDGKTEGWAPLPLWLPRSESKFAGLFAIDGSKAWAAGLTLRPLAESIVDVSRYEAALAQPIQVGPSVAAEQALLTHVQRDGE